MPEPREPADEDHAPTVSGLVEAAPLDSLEEATEPHGFLRRRLEGVVARVQGEQTLGSGQGIEGGRTAVVAAQEGVRPLVDSVVIADPLVERRERAGPAEEAGHQSLKASSRRLTRWARNSAALQARRTSAIIFAGDCSAANLPAAPRRDSAAQSWSA